MHIPRSILKCVPALQLCGLEIPLLHIINLPQSVTSGIPNIPHCGQKGWLDGSPIPMPPGPPPIIPGGTRPSSVCAKNKTKESDVRNETQRSQQLGSHLNDLNITYWCSTGQGTFTTWRQCRKGWKLGQSCRHDTQNQDNSWIRKREEK